MNADFFLIRAAVRADLERSLKTRLLMHTESLNGAEEEEQEDKVLNLILNPAIALSLNGSLFRDPGPYRDLFGILGPYWVSIYISGSLFSVFWLDSREECQFSLHVYNNELS